MAHLEQDGKRQTSGCALQVVFVHGVNTRDIEGSGYDRLVSARSDRLNRLAFGGRAHIKNPYWGKFGHAERTLKCLPMIAEKVEALGLGSSAPAETATMATSVGIDLRTITASLSVEAIREATQTCGDGERRAVEDYWLAAARFAEMRPTPSWLHQVSSLDNLAARLDAEVNAMGTLQTLGGWMPRLPAKLFDEFAAGRARGFASGLLAQFLGDALMFFSRRDAGKQVRHLIASAIIEAATAAASLGQPLVLIGHSMGGSVLHEMLTDADEVAAIETALGRPLSVDLFLSVGTQIGLFAELGQFIVPPDGPLAISCQHYWNVYDFADTLAFLAAPILTGVVDLEISTAGGLLGSHNAYFDSALFYTRLNDRLKQAGLVA